MSAEDITSRILRYPLDLTGTSPDNYIEAEICTLSNLRNRGVVLSNGPFYTESLEVFDNVTGEKLTKKVHYVAAQLVEAATVRSGKEVCSVIIVIDPSIGNQIRVNYQAVGGPYILNVDSLQEMMRAVEIDDRPVIWGAIVGKPSLFPAGHHLHDAGDIFGFEYFVLALEEVRKAIIMGDIASHDEITSFIGSVEDRLTARIVLIEDAAAAHLSDKNNPHETTKAQVGLSLVQNYGLSTKAQAEAGTVSTVYMTPLRVKEAITYQVGTALSDHVNDVENPHAVTQTQVGLSLVQNYGVATKLQAETGTASDLYMTPLRVKEAITYQAGAALKTHTDDKNNPHQVTPTQLSVYTKAETDLLLGGKLGDTEQAADSAKLDGKTRASILTDAYNAVGTMGKRNLHVSSLAPTTGEGVVGDVWFQY